MKDILNENQRDFKLQIGPEQTTKKGMKYKKLYVMGNSFEYNKRLKASGKKMSDEFGNRWDGTVKAWWFPVYQDKATGEYNPQAVANRKVKPYIDEINKFYKYDLGIEDLIRQIEEYTPDSNPEHATQEEKDMVVRKLEEFQEKLLNISSSEELQTLMKLMMDVKQGKGDLNMSPLNKIKVKLQKKNATHVNNRKNWLAWYNRKIKDGAQRIIVFAPAEKGFDRGVTQNFLRTKGKGWKQLTGAEKEEHYQLQKKANYGRARDFVLTAVYDVSDTEQIEGTQDELSANQEKARAAAAELGDRNLGDIGDTETSTDMAKIEPVFNGLLAYAEAQNMSGEIGRPREITAVSTKILASEILTKILSGKISGFAKKSSVAANSPFARQQQVEIASWEFMDAFGIPFNLADIDMNTIFGEFKQGKTPEETKLIKKRQIEGVLTLVYKAVRHLIDFVQKNSNISEVEGGAQVVKQITPMKIAKDIGLPNEFINDLEIGQLQERLRRKLKNL